MKSPFIRRIEERPSYQALVEETRRKYKEAEDSSTEYSHVISRYVLTFMEEDDLDKILRWDTLHRVGLWNPTMMDVVQIEKMLDTTLADILNWGRKMGYNV